MSIRTLHKRLSLRAKIITITLTISTTLLLFMSTVFISYHYTKQYDTLERSLDIYAKIITEAIHAPLAFGAAEEAQSILSMFGAVESIDAVVVFDTQGGLFSQHSGRAQGATTHRLEVPGLLQQLPQGTSYSQRKIVLRQPIKYEGEDQGTLVIVANTKELLLDLHRDITLLIFLLIATALVAYLLSAKLQKLITQPIFDLVNASQTVSQQKDYSIRVPMAADDEVGVLTAAFNEMLSKIQDREEALIEARNNLEGQVRQRTENLQLAVQSLERTEVSLRTVFDSVYDAIFVLNLDREIVDMNQKACEIFELTVEQADHYKHFDTFVEINWRNEKFSQIWLDALAGHQQLFEGEAKRPAAGQTFAVEIALHQIRLNDQEAVLANVRDITERKAAEKELLDASKKMVEIARMAGQAEVANNVIHNVGNVLNSANVTLGVLQSKMRQCKIMNFGMAAELLNQNQENLALFLSDDQKGRKLPGYIIGLTQHVTEEFSEYTSMLEELNKHIQHISDIIAIQQSNGRVVGFHEQVDLRELIADVLTLYSNSFSRHRIHLIEDYMDCCPISLDKHNMMQILVNLVGNSVQALKEVEDHPRRLNIQLKTTADNHTKINVVDNGIGIKSDHMKSIFNHGFTTKKDGHGFGLHSAANTAKSLGWNLEAFSEGQHKGATFSLTIPNG